VRAFSESARDRSLSISLVTATGKKPTVEATGGLPGHSCGRKSARERPLHLEMLKASEKTKGVKSGNGVPGKTARAVSHCLDATFAE